MERSAKESWGNGRRELKDGVGSGVILGGWVGRLVMVMAGVLV